MRLKQNTNFIHTLGTFNGCMNEFIRVRSFRGLYTYGHNDVCINLQVCSI